VTPPQEPHSRIDLDVKEYALIFSDEFNQDDRSLYIPATIPSAEPCYGQTGDLEWYDPQLSVMTLMVPLTSTSRYSWSAPLPLLHIPSFFNDITGSAAPFTPADNHNLSYRSGMLQSWNKFCFTQGYIEVKVVFPGSDESSKGYVSTFFLLAFIVCALTIPLIVAWRLDNGKPGKTRI
jgi:beta-glucanase (GH16 family)